MSDKPKIPDLSVHFKSGLEQAVHSYLDFKKTKVANEPKDFTAYHNACKSALMHIALLLKLIQNTANSDNQTVDTDWLKIARQALQTESEESDEAFFPY